MISTLKRLTVQTLDSGWGLMLTSLIDHLVLGSSLSGRDARHPRSHLLINSTGGGNIGDQAMFESFVLGVGGSIKAIVRDADAFQVPALPVGVSVELVVLPNLVYGRGLGRLMSVVKFARAARDSRSLSIVGADVMDGGYGRRPSIMEWSLATASARAGIPTRILGFSWKEGVDQRVEAAARRAVRFGVEAMARDSLSKSRLLSGGVSAVTQTADLVFLLDGPPQRTQQERHVANWKSAGKRIAVVNMSGLIEASMNQRAEYDTIIQSLRGLGHEIVLLPHVSSDIPVIRDFLAGHPEAEFVFVDRLLTPLQVRTLVGHVDVVVTGRMHLSIIALSLGVPAIVLATQGKVLGLLELVGTPRNCIDPVVGFGRAVMSRLESLEDNRADVLSSIGIGVIQARKMARENFRGL